MSIVLIGLIIFISIEHFYFLVLEMFFWIKPLGLKTFKMSEQDAKSSQVLAANQGLYNGFLASGLVYSLFLYQTDEATSLLYFLFISIAIAGIYGAYSTKKIKLFYIQGIPALLALVVLILQ